MRKQAISYIARVLVQKIIGFLLYMIGAGFTLTYAGSIYFIYLLVATIIISLVLFKSNEETLAQRGKTDTDSPVWDKVLLTLFWLLNCIGLCMIFPYWSVWVCMAITIVTIVVRTVLEDKMLKDGLDGYLEYTNKTKYKLIPFIW